MKLYNGNNIPDVGYGTWLIKNEDAWYDLNGRQIVNRNLHGIYIVGGRKIVR